MKLPGKGYPWKQFAKDLKREYKVDNIGDAAAALTYYGVLALFPFLLFLVSLATLVIDPAQAEQIVREASSALPEQAGKIIGDRIHSLMASQSVGLLSVGAIGALWSASSGVAAVIRALNVTYDVEESRPFWKVRGVALLFTIGGGLLAIVAALVMVALPALANAIGGPIGTVILLLRFPVAAALMMFVWAVAYYALPDVEQKFTFITPGSVIGVVVWLIASVGFSLYVRNFGKYDATYGSLGGVIVMLLWMWISAQVLLIGAEINSVIEHASPEGKSEGEKTLQGAEARTGGKVESKYGEGPGKRRTPRSLQFNKHADGSRTPTPEHRAPNEAWRERFSPSQLTLSRRQEASLERPRSPARRTGTVKRLAFAAWGAFVGLAFVRARRSA